MNGRARCSGLSLSSKNENEINKIPNPIPSQPNTALHISKVTPTEPKTLTLHTRVKCTANTSTN